MLSSLPTLNITICFLLVFYTVCLFAWRDLPVTAILGMITSLAIK